MWLSRQKTLLMLLVAGACASSDVGTPAPQATKPGPRGDECRPTGGVPWRAGDQLVLPCERTVEPCDGIDNNGDGITDPHCSTVVCNSHSDCTLDGLLPDAACDYFNEPAPVCRAIDAYPLSAGEGCAGVVCPVGLKCVDGDCLEPGAGSPGSYCDSGADCPANSGCVPTGRGDATRGICTEYCHDNDCPSGSICFSESREVGLNGYTSQTCHVIACAAGSAACESLIRDCTADSCPTRDCAAACERSDDAPCVLACLAGSDDPKAQPLFQCLNASCAP